MIVARGSVVAQGTADELLAKRGCATLEDAIVQLAGEGLPA